MTSVVTDVTRLRRVSHIEALVLNVLLRTLAFVGLT